MQRAVLVSSQCHGDLPGERFIDIDFPLVVYFAAMDKDLIFQHDGMTKELIVKDDGRFLYLYTFEEPSSNERQDDSGKEQDNV